MNDMPTWPAADPVLQRLEDLGERLEVDAGGGTMVWRRWGHGPALVLVHGGSGSWSHWVRNIEALSATHTVLTPDLPGYGDSDDVPPGEGLETLCDMTAAALVSLLPAGERADLVAFSFGGVVAGLVAEQLPTRVRQLVLVGAVGFGIPRVGQRPMQSWRRELDPERLAEIHRDNLSSLMIMDPQRIDDLAIALQARNAERTRFISKHAAHTPVLRDTLATLIQPVHGIWGRGDVTTSGQLDSIERWITELSPASRFHIIEDAGHWVQYERAEAFNEALAQVLRPA